MVWDERIDNNLRKVDAYNDGKTEGILDAKREMVINLYTNNVSIEIIAKSANLPISEVEDIINNVKK